MEIKNSVIAEPVDYLEVLPDDKTLVQYISTPKLDNQGDIMQPKGMDDNKFRCVLWGHSKGLNIFSDYVPAPSNLIIADSKWRKADDIGVKTQTEFLDTPLGRDVYYFNKIGLLKHWSIGWSDKTEPILEKREGKRALVHYKWYLHEYSSVLFPANDEAQNTMEKECKDEIFKKSLEDLKIFDKIKHIIFGDINDKFNNEFEEIKQKMIDPNEYVKREMLDEVQNKLNILQKSIEVIINKENKQADKKELEKLITDSFYKNL